MERSVGCRCRGFADDRDGLGSGVWACGVGLAGSAIVIAIPYRPDPPGHPGVRPLRSVSRESTGLCLCLGVTGFSIVPVYCITYHE